MEQERILALALCRVEGIGAVSIRKLLEKAGDVSEIRKLSAESLQKLLGEKKAALLKNWDAPENLEQAKRQAEQWKKKGISFDFLWEEAYPKRLKEISDPPLVLYRIGKLPEPEKKMTAIVGARACSSYGKEMAEYFARGLAKEGIGIVSGMARGADGIAQRAALSAGGYSVAVLGCGVDICYPEENRPLYEKLWENGCILSEYPPGTQPHSRLFPPRNRIISALSDLVLVIEAREKSGTLITVDMALEQGKDVFAVPGRITDTCSRGCRCDCRQNAVPCDRRSQLYRLILLAASAQNDLAGAGYNAAEHGRNCGYPCETEDIHKCADADAGACFSGAGGRCRKRNGAILQENFCLQ